MPIVFRAAEPTDRPRLLSLFESAFKSPPDPKEWDWKYDENPHPATSVVAADRDRLLGFFGALGTRYRGAAGDRPGTSTVDVMTRRDARTLGQGSLFRELGEAFKELNATHGIPFDFGFPHERARRIEERLLGCVTVERAGHLVRDVAAEPRRSGSRVLLGVAFGPEHASLAETLHARAGWRTDRSAVTLNWRFKRPGVRYDAIQLLDAAGRSCAYAVIRLVADRALLVDVQLADEEGRALYELLAAVTAHVQSRARRLEVRAPQDGTLAQRLREELGFGDEVSDTHFFVRPFDPEFDLLHAAKSFDYRFSDHDVF